MNVKELIDTLQGFDCDTKVELSVEVSRPSGNLTEVERPCNGFSFLDGVVVLHATHLGD